MNFLGSPGSLVKAVNVAMPSLSVVSALVYDIGGKQSSLELLQTCLKMILVLGRGLPKCVANTLNVCVSGGFLRPVHLMNGRTSIPCSGSARRTFLHLRLGKTPST